MQTFPKEFIMLCGLPKTGKSEIAKSECERLLNSGFYQVDSSKIYTIDQMMSDITMYLDKSKVTEALRNQKDIDTQAFTLISINNIRNELYKHGDIPNNSNLALISEARLNIALARGYTVIYDAMNLAKDVRRKYITLANAFGVKEKKIIVANIEKEQAISILEGGVTPTDAIPALYDRFMEDYPDASEGWDIMIKYFPCTES